ncbi:MAG TPA: potassium channel family protein [Thermoanaerobaculia bacterium]|nr:potassium channel family protein [Thermoanaerobaculia bacterium]
MTGLRALAGSVIVLVILWDAFESIVLPRRVTHRFRLTRLFYAVAWNAVAAVARRVPAGKPRQALLSAFGPLSLLMLVAFWAVGLVFGFSLLHAAVGTAGGFPMDLYMSGSTFFTLGLGDVTPKATAGRIVTVLEAGVGFGFLALTIGYLPVIYGAFSRRETNISLLDARAGSPPSARELLSRYGRPEHVGSLARFLRDWEVWTADLMESHLSYPVLCYYRSQHDNQSWLAALTAILDTCALLIAHAEGEIAWQARLTYAIARHAVVDLSQVLHIAPRHGSGERLSPSALAEIRAELRSAGVPLCAPKAADETLQDVRRMYEPYVAALADRLMMTIPGWSHPNRPANWQTSAWEKETAAERRP